MNILVFGKTGQVARELQRIADVTALGRDDADLSRPERCAEAIRTAAPDLVINAAAYTAVDRAEEDEAQATLINADAPGAMARACAAQNIPFCHISTDYVFDGTGTEPRSPSDPVAPCNAYGRSKRAGEVAVRDAGGRAAILRTSWVVSAHGNNFIKTMLRLAETRESLTVVEDQIGGPTPAADIAAALLRIGRAMVAGHEGGLYHFSGAPDTSWAGFAREIFSRSGAEVDVFGIPTSEYPTPAPRPLNSRLDCGTLEADFGIARPDWRAGLSLILKDLALT
ncbi:dTDP-4-dehydrorhamnose reductase [uncultured Roseovarius sp.]|uniref:dTDP-4-dehydrorhamnose reductase n=1 Tax=uncultured Roseovarius sp. TaxID=293344 RepID=UPI0026060D60|nr:dTDP-4-dehydrorhamnose reductase [uncultured Roseovarius sp.]